jgi:hypothetical protein
LVAIRIRNSAIASAGLLLTSPNRISQGAAFGRDVWTILFGAV